MVLYLTVKMLIKGEQPLEWFLRNSKVYPICLHAWNKLFDKKMEENDLVRLQLDNHSI